MRIVVVGGGYAGLSCLMALADRLPDTQRVLVDPARYHIKLTRLQEGLRRPAGDLRVPFEKLAARYGFRHVSARPSLGATALRQAAATGRLSAGGLDEGFDVLVVAVGLKPRPRPRQPGCVGLSDLRRTAGSGLVGRIEREAGGSKDRVTVVGGGATGLQYLFELSDALRRQGAPTRLSLVDPGSRLLPRQPGQFHDYVSARMKEAGIGYLRGYRLVSARGHRLQLESGNGKPRELASRVTLVLTGQVGNPARHEAADSGQVVIDGELLDTVFAAGDCSVYDGPGLNSPSAQAAVRKGRHVAENIARLARGRRLKGYRARELGFFLSMGMLDGIGWVGRSDAVLTGAPAFAVREAIETRYELFVRGLDTFQVL